MKLGTWRIGRADVGVYRSSDGGKTFNGIPVPHGDNHDLWIDPDDPQRMIESNDGGANVSFNGGRTWSSIMNQPTAQFYRVTTDDRFPYWDVLLYPLRKASDTAELDHVEVRRLSPYEVELLSDEGPKKLEGVKSGHFGAFFSRKARENDYLWGRLDAAEWIVRLLFNEADPLRCADVFDAVLASERDLRAIAELRGDLQKKVDAIRSGSGIPG